MRIYWFHTSNKSKILKGQKTQPIEILIEKKYHVIFVSANMNRLFQPLGLTVGGYLKNT